MPHQEIQQALKRKKNVSKVVTLQNLNEELLSISKEQYLHLRACALPSTTESENEAEEQERIRPKTNTASEEVANISQQHGALLREVVFNTVPGTVNVRRAAAAQTPSISSSSEEEAGILKDMADQLSQVPDTQLQVVRGASSLKPIHEASMPMVGAMLPPK